EYEADQLAYNFKTQKGRVTSGRTVQGEGFILTDVAKYMEDGSIFGKGGKYTTCNDPDHPHYYIRSRKLKLTNNNQIISGPLNLVIADLPLPVIIPFAFIPTPPEGKVSGILQPNYGNAQDRGYFLRGLGYYKAINDYFDVQIDGDIYTRGGWRLGLASTYRVQHSFSGNLRFQYGVQRFNERGDPDFRRTAAWSVNWSHNQPINPNTRLSSSVNISSSNSFQREISLERQDFFTNDLNSSINFQKTFANTPFSMNLGLRHQQDLNDGLMSMSLPELTVNMNRQNPFKNLQGKNLGFLKQLGVNYNMSARNRVQNLPDSLFLPVLLNPADSVWISVVENGDTLAKRIQGSSFYNNGLEHRASASTQIKLFNYLNISPSFNYREVWLTETTERFFDAENNTVETVPVRGFERAFDYNTSVTATTNFYGLYGLPRSRREIVFRQRFTPNVNYSLRPDFAD
ncbi:MAG: putative LPS assembly protein LptD, partial [Bacteroidota bacterium]